MNRGVVILAAAGAAALTAGAARAQVVPPLEDVVIQGEILNRSAAQAVAPGVRGGAGQSDELDGEAGLYVLTLNEIFFVSARAGAGSTSNATRTSTDPGSDSYADLGFSLGVATRLGGMVDVSATLNAEGRDFTEVEEASSQSASLTVSAGRQIGPVYAGLTGFGGYAWDRGFDGETAFYGLSASASLPLRLSPRLQLRPGLGFTQQWSDTQENNSATATGFVDAAYAVTPRWVVSGRLSYSERRYDDFYEDVTFVERRDSIVGGSLSLVWRPRDNLAVAGSIAYEDQRSTLFLSEFEAFDSTLNLALRKTF
jgi:hypothetical protein